jgi:putative phage-type endonuclease
MITHKLIQGSPEWHEYRRTQFNASDAPAMLGCSPYKTRTELLHEMATGIYPEIDEETQRRFDDGHRFEALARPLAEEIIGDDLYPEVGGNGKLSASFDGLTANHGICFEHKTLNASLKDITRAGQLPEQYRVQMEQQLWLSGATKCLFMASKWDGESLVQKMHVWYESDQDLRDRIIQGWVQFAADLDNYIPAEIIKKTQADPIRQLPAVLVSASGGLSASNLQDLAPQYDSFIAKANLSLSAIDIVNGKAIAKFSRDAAKDLIAKSKGVIDQIVTVSDAVQTMEFYAAKFNKIGLDYEKAVDRMQKAEADAALAHVEADYSIFVAELQQSLDPIKLVVPRPNFALAIKSLKTPESKNAALNAALSNAKIAASQMEADVRGKMLWFNANHKAHDFLFPDMQTIVYKLSEDFKLLIASRIDQHTTRTKFEAEAKAKRIQDDLQQAKDERAKREAETVAVSEKSAEIHSMAAESVYPAMVAIYPGDAALLKVIMEQYHITKGQACDWILLAAENMREAA